MPLERVETHVASAEAAEARNAVRPRLEAMPGAIELIDNAGGQVDAALLQEEQEMTVMEFVCGLERKLPPHHLADAADVSVVPPGIDERVPVGLHVVLTPDGLTLPYDGGPPVDDGTEDIEREGTNLGQIQHWGGSSSSLPLGQADAGASAGRVGSGPRPAGVSAVVVGR